MDYLDSPSDHNKTLYPPSLKTLTDAKAFDDFKNEADWQERLALVKNAPDAISQIRYAWLLHYQGDAKTSLERLLIYKNHPLAYVLVMDALISLDRHDELLEYLAQWNAPTSAEWVEATIIGYEVSAFVHAILIKDSFLAFRFLHHAEALAKHYDLNRRLQVIHNHLELVANASDTPIVLQQIKHPNVSSLGFVQSMRFQSYLRAENLEALNEDPFISKDMYDLAQATLMYNRWFDQPESIARAAHLITDQVPSNAEFRVYWALLMLQTFTQRGAQQGLASPYRIVKVLKEGLDGLKYSDFEALIGFSSRMYPLGLALATKIDERLSMANDSIAIIWPDRVRDGVRYGSEKLATIPSRVRSALIKDGLNGSFSYTSEVFRFHATYKQRLNLALKTIDLNLAETTNIGSLYRGFDHLFQNLKDKQFYYHARSLSQQSSLLKSLLPR